MGRETLEAVVEWQRALGAGPDVHGLDADRPDNDGAGPRGRNGNGTLEITFHGGEPLVPGAAW
jgi:hypothetical protein